MTYGIQYEFRTLEEKEQIELQYGNLDLEHLTELHEAGILSEEKYEEIYYTTENVLWLKNNLYQLAILLIMTMIGSVLINYVKQRINIKVSAEFQKKTISKLTDSIMQLSQEHLDIWKSGELIRRYVDAEIVADGIISTLLTGIIDIILAVAGGIVLCQQSKQLFMVVGGMVIVYAIVVICFVRPIKCCNIKAMESETIQSNLIKESVDSIMDTKIYSKEKYVSRLINQKTEEAIEAIKIVGKIDSNQSSMVSFLSGICEVIILIVAFTLISEGEIAISTYIAFSAMMSFFISPIEGLLNLQPIIQNSIVAAERLSDIMDDVREDNSVKVRYRLIQETINIRNITYRYGNNIEVFNDFSCKIPVGKTTLIAGQNGSGKSTLAKLIFGMYICEAGQILYDDININDIAIGELHCHSIYIPQKSGFITMSIKDTICFGDEEISQKNLEEICNIVGIRDWIEVLPQGYNTLIEEQGRNLSAGQCQRVALARALIKKPDILFLDEATSNIDEKSECEILKNIRDKYPNITLILIMHNLSDKIEIDHVVNV